MPHPGGTLLEHLLRVADRLGAWGADRDLQLAGLCHAAYGTDGFEPCLVQPADRAALAALIGEPAEALVHLYATCDRATVHPRLGRSQPVVFRDRLTGREYTPPDADVRAFLEITAANELDVLAHDAELAERHGPALQALFSSSRDLLSAPAREACDRQLGRHATGATPEIRS